MKLHIHDNLPLLDLEERFRNSFPGLTLRFYRHAHGNKTGSPPEDQLDPRMLVGKARHRSGKEGLLTVLSTDTVSHFESLLRDEYGLYAQVFRLEPGCDIQTTQTDRYTLAQQMELVRHFEKSIFPQTNDQVDEYDALLQTAARAFLQLPRA